MTDKTGMRILGGFRGAIGLGLERAGVAFGRTHGSGLGLERAAEAVGRTHGSGLGLERAAKVGLPAAPRYSVPVIAGVTDLVPSYPTAMVDGKFYIYCHQTYTDYNIASQNDYPEANTDYEWSITFEKLGGQWMPLEPDWNISWGGTVMIENLKGDQIGTYSGVMINPAVSGYFIKYWGWRWDTLQMNLPVDFGFTEIIITDIQINKIV